MVGANENLAGMECHPLFLIPTVADFILYKRRVNKNQFFFFTYPSKQKHWIGILMKPLIFGCMLKILSLHVHPSPGLIALTHS